MALPAGYSPSVAFVGDTGQVVIGSTGGSVAIVDGGGVGAAVSQLGDRVVDIDLAGWASARAGRRRNARSGRCRRRRAGRQHERRTDRGGGRGRRPTRRPCERTVRRRLGRDASCCSAPTPATSWRRSTDAATLTAIAVGPNDKAAVLGAAADGTIRTWSRDADSLVAGDAVELPEPIGRPRQLVASPDGRRVLVTGDAGSALVNLATGAAESVEVGATGLVAIDPSGRYAAIGGAQLTVWDLTTGQRAFAVPEPANALAWSGPCDGDVPCKLVTAGESLDVWDPAAGRRVRLADQTNAQAVAISDDGSTVVTAGWGATVAVWQLAAQIDDTGRVELAPPGPLTVGRPGDRSAGALRRRVDGRRPDRRFDDDRGDRPDHRAHAHRRRFPCAGRRPRRTATARDRGRRARSLSTHGATAISFAVSPRGAYLMTYQPSTGATVVCDASTGEMLAGATIEGSAEPVGAVAVDDDGDVALAGGGGFVEHYRVDGQRFATGVAVDVRFGGEAVDVTSLALRDGTIAAGIRPAGGRAAVSRVLVWDATGGGTPVQFDTDYRDVAAVGLLGPSADLVVVAGVDVARGTVLQVWEVETRRRLGRALGGLAGDVVSLGGDASAVLGVDSEGRALSWSLVTDPSSEICTIVGRPMRADEWDSIAGGALGAQPYSAVCDP